MSKYLTDLEKSLIVELSAKGYSSREISKKLWGVDSKKSTVNDYLNRTNEVFETAKILIWDVETSPSIGYYWRRWKENIGQNQVIQESYMLTWSAKYLNSDAIIQKNISDYGKDFTVPNDKELLEELLDTLNECDIAVAHNGVAFDNAVFNTRCLANGLPLIDVVKHVDTLKIAKKHFRFPSNSLKSLAIYLGLDEQKQDVDFTLWSRVMEGDKDAIVEMSEYCSQDILTLEQVYLKLRPYDSRHPNVNLKGDLSIPRCAKCGSADIDKTGKTVTTNVSVFEHYRCNSCGTNLRGRENLLTKDQRKNIISNVV